MPLFEYTCLNCDKRFTFLTGVVSDEDAPRCPRCQSEQLRKLMSRFSRGRSDDDRMEELGERVESQDFNDPRQMRRFAREMGREMGSETGENLADEMEALFENEIDAESGSHPGGGGGDDGTIY